jgi:hypothetical protein
VVSEPRPFQQSIKVPLDFEKVAKSLSSSCRENPILQFSSISQMLPVISAYS